MGTRSVHRQADERRACRRKRNTRRWSEWPGRRDRTGRHERRDAIAMLLFPSVEATACTKDNIGRAV